MRLRLILGLCLVGVALVGSLSTAQAPPTPDPTLLAETLQPLIDSRFTETAAYFAWSATGTAVRQSTRQAAETYMFEMTSTGEAIGQLDLLAETAFYDALTATATGITPTPSITPTPTATFQSVLNPTAVPTALPVETSQYLRQAYDALYWENYRTAELNFRSAISQTERIAEAHYGLGVTLSGGYQHRDAVYQFEVARSLGVTDPDLFFRLAEGYYRQGDYDLAQVYIDSALERKYFYAPYHLLAAAVARQQFRYDTAINHYLAAIHLTQSYDTILGLAFYLEEVVESVGTMEYRRLAEFYRALGLGIAYSEVLRVEDAMSYYTSALELAQSDRWGLREPGNFPTTNTRLPEEWVYYHRAFLHLNLNEIESATADLDRALTLHPDFGHALVFHAELMIDAGVDNETINFVLQQANRSQPTNPDLQWAVLARYGFLAQGERVREDLIAGYLRASATRQIALPTASFGSVEIPYMEQGWVYLLELPNLPGERVQVYIDYMGDSLNLSSLLVAIDPSGQNLTYSNPYSQYQFELTIGDRPVTLMLGLNGWNYHPPYREPESAQVRVFVERVPLNSPESTEEPDPYILTNTPLPTATRTLAPLVAPQHLSPTPTNDVPESIYPPPTLTPTPTAMG